MTSYFNRSKKKVQIKCSKIKLILRNVKNVKNNSFMNLRCFKQCLNLQMWLKSPGH